MGYLDKDGLTYLWGKIKAALNTKLDKPSGTKGQYLGFTANDTLGAVSLPNASTGARGITYLVDSYTRTDTDKAVTPRALNNVYKLVADKQAKITASGLLKGDGSGGVTAAEAGTDYATPDGIPTKLSDLTGDTTHRVVSDTEKATWNSKADKSVSKTATLTAAKWSNGLQTLAVSGIAVNSNGSLRIAQSATDEEFEAWGAAKPRVTAQAAGSLTVKAVGTVPDIDISVEVIII